MRYKTKPIFVEARQLSESTRNAIQVWAGKDAWFYESNGDAELYIGTPTGTEVAIDGDWIIKKANGELAVCSPEEFSVSYESAE